MCLISVCLGVVCVLILELVSMLIFATIVIVVILPRHGSSRLDTRPYAQLDLSACLGFIMVLSWSSSQCLSRCTSSARLGDRHVARRNTWLGRIRVGARLVTRHGKARHGRGLGAYHGMLYWAVLRHSLLT